MFLIKVAFSDFVNYFLMFLKTYHVLGSVYCVIFGRKFKRPSIPWYVFRNIEIFFKVWKFGQDKFAILRYLDLCLILFLFHFDELTDASMRKESTILLQTAMARHVTLKTAYLKPETNGILTENHFNICTSHPICMKLAKFDTKWRLMNKCSIILIFTTLLPILWIFLIETSKYWHFLSYLLSEP